MKAAVPYKPAAIDQEPLQLTDAEDLGSVALTIQKLDGIKPVA